MNLEIKSGRNSPITDGRYLCFVSHDLDRGVALPIILVWHAATWHLPYNMIAHRAPVYGYAGPLPIGRCAELFPDCVSESFFAPRGQRPTSEIRRFEALTPGDHVMTDIGPDLEYDL